MDTPTARDLARHAKLFELLRQQNIARATRARGTATPDLSLADRQNFKRAAEQSLSADPARPGARTPG